MDEERVRSILRETRVPGGKVELSLEELVRMQPGLARLMPEIGERTWRLYHGARARNWPYARYQWRVARNLLELCAKVRPKHRPALEMYLRDDWAPLERAIEDADLEAFLAAFERAVESANVWHERKNKGFIRWKVPEQPPADVDLGPAG
jgi:hypothetical protein